MPLYIRDDEVDALAEELKAVTGAPSKTEAVRTALANELARKRAETTLEERVRKIQERARVTLGPPDPKFDFRKLREELWGDED